MLLILCSSLALVLVSGLSIKGHKHLLLPWPTLSLLSHSALLTFLLTISTAGKPHDILHTVKDEG